MYFLPGCHPEKVSLTILVATTLALFGCASTSSTSHIIRPFDPTQELSPSDGLLLVGGLEKEGYTLEFKVAGIAEGLKQGYVFSDEELRTRSLTVPGGKGSFTSFFVFPIKANKYIFTSVEIGGETYHSGSGKSFKIEAQTATYIGHIQFPRSDRPRKSIRWQVWNAAKVIEKKLCEKYPCDRYRYREGLIK